MSMEHVRGIVKFLLFPVFLAVAITAAATWIAICMIVALTVSPMIIVAAMKKIYAEGT